MECQPGCRSREAHEGGSLVVGSPEVSMRARRASSGGGVSVSGGGGVGGSGGGLPRLVIAAGVAAAAVGVGVARRLLVGATRATPPVPDKRPHDVVFGDAKAQGDAKADGSATKKIADPYFWMRDDDRGKAEVIAHLKEENAYTNGKTLRLRKNARRLYKELLSHIQETDEDVPTPYGNYEYYTRTVAGSSYVFHCRRPVAADGTKGDEEIVLDENSLAKGKKHCDVGAVEVSPDHKILAYAVDFTGDEKYSVHFLDLATRKLFESDSIAETNGYVEWGRDNNDVFYGTMDAAQRSNKVWRRRMRYGGDSAAEDECLYTEDDEVFSAYFGKALSGRFLFIVSSASTMSEVRYIDLDAPGFNVSLVAERETDVLYSVNHAGDSRFLITTNADGATNFKVMECEVGAPRSSWKDFLPYKPERTILGVTSFEKFSIVSGREGGFAGLWVLPGRDPSAMYRLPVDETSSVVGLGENMEYKAEKFRFLYSSMKTPSQTWDYNVTSKERVLLKENPVPNYDRNLYKTERLEATSADGVKIPMSLVWNENAVPAEGPRLLHLYGYGSYGISIDPSFSSNILPLLDRGVVYCIAHIRGGGEGGRAWYEAARFETKPKSFQDFIACAEMLVSSGRTTPDKLSMEGRSAGGLLMGSVMNMRPDLFRAAIAGVPFVDVLNTMSDASIPLTTGEWLEWGNPNDIGKYFNAIKGYCPYQNVAAKSYPAALVVAGLHDPRVAYWEPAKWVAKLREHTTSGHDILLKVDLDSGHFSASDRYAYKKQRAFELAWLLNEVGAPVGRVG